MEFQHDSEHWQCAATIWQCWGRLFARWAEMGPCSSPQLSLPATDGGGLRAPPPPQSTQSSRVLAPGPAFLHRCLQTSSSLCLQDPVPLSHTWDSLMSPTTRLPELRLQVFPSRLRLACHIYAPCPASNTQGWGHDDYGGWDTN